MWVMRRLPTATFALLAALLLLVEPAAANLSGEGLVEGNDKNVTNAGFILIAFFPAFVLVASLILHALEKRKERRKQAAKARGANHHWNAGW